MLILVRTRAVIARRAAVAHRAPGGVRATALAAACALALLAVAVPAAAGTSTADLHASITWGSLGRFVPRSFLGLSVEYNELGIYERSGVLFDRAMSLIRGPGGQPLLLRIGGRSADDAYWKTSPSGAPGWVFELGDTWLRDLAALTRRDRLRVLLDLNLAVHSPAMATAFVRAARAALPSHAIAGLSIGNEPDLYWHEPGLARERILSTSGEIAADWTRDYTGGNYTADYLSYARALASAEPGIPLAAPETAALHLDWMRLLGELGPLSPRSMTVHRYASSTCRAKDSPRYPTIATLLNPTSSAGLAARLIPAVRLAQDDGFTLRVSEMNSISCGGDSGVANSFATALWAPDALFSMVKAGVAAVNWHIRPGLANSPFQVGQDFTALPEFYGLVTFARMVGPGAQLVGTSLRQARGLRLVAWAVRRPASLSLLVINKGPTAATVGIAAGTATTPAEVARLQAPSIASSSGVTLGGRWLGADARWYGSRATQTIQESEGAYRLSVPAYSAALVALDPRVDVAPS